LVDLGLRNAVIDELEEADPRRGIPELVRDLRLARLEIAEVDLRNFALLHAAYAAEGGFLVEFDKTIVFSRHIALHRLLRFRCAAPKPHSVKRSNVPRRWR